MRAIRIVVFGVCVALGGQMADAQTVASASSSEQDWHVTVYPVLAWVPLNIAIDVNIPPTNIDGGGSGQILNSRFDGAFFGGFTASNAVWRVEGYGLWASFGGDRPERPVLSVDLDLIYGSGKLGRRIAPDLFVTG